MRVDHFVGGSWEESILHHVFVILWAWMSTMMMIFSLAMCSWHRRRMQRRREGSSTYFLAVAFALVVALV